MGHRCFPAWLADVPELDAALAPRVHVLGRVRHSDGDDNFTVGKSVDLVAVSRDSLGGESVLGKGYRLQLVVSTHMEGVEGSVGVSLASEPQGRGGSQGRMRVSGNIRGWQLVVELFRSMIAYHRQTRNQNSID